MPWSAQSWLPGAVATDEDTHESAEFACDLADFVTDVRNLDTGGRSFAGPGRGGICALETPGCRSALTAPRVYSSGVAAADLAAVPAVCRGARPM